MFTDGFRLHSSLRTLAPEVFTLSLSHLRNISHQTHLRFPLPLPGCPCSLMNYTVIYASGPHKVAQVKTRLGFWIWHHHNLVGIPNKKLNEAFPRRLGLHRSLRLGYRFQVGTQTSRQNYQPTQYQPSSSGKRFLSLLCKSLGFEFGRSSVYSIWPGSMCLLGQCNR